jgi:hypothetical protein
VNHLSIANDGSGGARVELDGRDISRALQGLSFTVDTRTLPYARAEVVLSLPVIDVSTVSEADVLIPQATHDLLVQLGWTPPAEAKEGDS